MPPLFSHLFLFLFIFAHSSSSSETALAWLSCFFVFSCFHNLSFPSFPLWLCKNYFIMLFSGSLPHFPVLVACRHVLATRQVSEACLDCDWRWPAHPSTVSQLSLGHLVPRWWHCKFSSSLLFPFFLFLWLSVSGVLFSFLVSLSWFSTSFPVHFLSRCVLTLSILKRFNSPNLHCFHSTSSLRPHSSQVSISLPKLSFISAISILHASF